MLTTRNAFSKTGPDPTSSANVATEKETPVISSLTASSSPKSGLNWTPTQTVLPSSKSPAQPKGLSPNSAFLQSAYAAHKPPKPPWLPGVPEIDPVADRYFWNDSTIDCLSPALRPASVRLTFHPHRPCPVLLQHRC